VIGSLVWFGEQTPNIYYLPNTTGWGPNFGGLSTVLWQPQLQMTSTPCGIPTSPFGFNLQWAGGQTVVVEASTNFPNPNWCGVPDSTVESKSK
jgi:hypothetical protein